MKYQALAADGKNKKSKRHVLSGRRKKRSNEKHQHRTGYCGNLACKDCFPFKADGTKRVRGPAFEATKREKAKLLIKPSFSLRPTRPNRGLGRLIVLGRGTALETVNAR